MRALRRCDAARFGFERPAPGVGYFKFPATIGATGAAPVLFIGINPRRSASNVRLHRDVMASERAFRLFAANRVPDSEGRDAGPYIRSRGPERHYDLHLAILERAFGPGPIRFEEHAAVTELLLCATESAPAVDLGASPCAERFLARTVAQVRPEVIVAVGAAVDGYLRRRTPHAPGLAFYTRAVGVGSWVIPVPHPSAHGVTGATRTTATEATGRWIRDILDVGAPSERPPFTGQIAEDWRRFGGEPTQEVTGSRAPGRAVRAATSGPAGRLRGHPPSSGGACSRPGRFRPRACSSQP